MSPRVLSRLLAPVVALAVGLTACGDAFHRPAAVVNGTGISDDELRVQIPLMKVLSTLVGQTGPCGSATRGESGRSACARSALGLLIELSVARPFAEEHDVSVSADEVDGTIEDIRDPQTGMGPDQLDALLHRYGVTPDGLKQLVRQQLFLGRLREAVARDRLTDGELRKAYVEHKLDFTELHAAHILVGTEQEADRIAAEVTPENFAELAKRFSNDRGSAEQGGDLGTIPAGRLDPQFVQAAVALSPGEISDPVQTRFGWHIIRLISVTVEPFENVREQIRVNLSGEALHTWLVERYRDGDLDVNPRFGRLDVGSASVVPLNSTSTSEPSPAASPS